MKEQSKHETVAELQARIETLEAMKRVLEARLAGTTEEERRELEVLSERAIHPQCRFDRKYRRELYVLALFPKDATWKFRFKKAIHDALHHH